MHLLVRGTARLIIPHPRCPILFGDYVRRYLHPIHRRIIGIDAALICLVFQTGFLLLCRFPCELKWNLPQ